MWPAVKSYSICVGGNRHSGCPLEGCSLVVGGWVRAGTCQRWWLRWGRWVKYGEASCVQDNQLGRVKFENLADVKYRFQLASLGVGILSISICKSSLVFNHKDEPSSGGTCL